MGRRSPFKLSRGRSSTPPATTATDAGLGKDADGPTVQDIGGWRADQTYYVNRVAIVRTTPSKSPDDVMQMDIPAMKQGATARDADGYIRKGGWDGWLPSCTPDVGPCACPADTDEARDEHSAAITTPPTTNDRDGAAEEPRILTRTNDQGEEELLDLPVIWSADAWRRWLLCAPAAADHDAISAHTGRASKTSHATWDTARFIVEADAAIAAGETKAKAAANMKAAVVEEEGEDPEIAMLERQLAELKEQLEQEQREAAAKQAGETKKEAAEAASDAEKKGAASQVLGNLSKGLCACQCSEGDVDVEEEGDTVTANSVVREEKTKEKSKEVTIYKDTAILFKSALDEETTSGRRSASPSFKNAALAKQTELIHAKQAEKLRKEKAKQAEWEEKQRQKLEKKLAKARERAEQRAHAKPPAHAEVSITSHSRGSRSVRSMRTGPSASKGRGGLSVTSRSRSSRPEGAHSPLSGGGLSLRLGRVQSARPSGEVASGDDFDLALAVEPIEEQPAEQESDSALKIAEEAASSVPKEEGAVSRVEPKSAQTLNSEKTDDAKSQTPSRISNASSKKKKKGWSRFKLKGRKAKARTIASATSDEDTGEVVEEVEAIL